MSLNSWMGWDRGANQEAATYALQNDGQISINPIQRLFGASENDVQNIIDTKQQKALNNQYGAMALQAGLNPFSSGFANYGESEGQFLARIRSGSEAKTEKERNRQRTERIEDEGRALTQATTLKNMDLQAGRDQFATTLRSQQNQYAHQSKENALNRRHESELAGSREDLQMQMAIMNAELADKRMAYDRETRRMDRRDRMIAQLMSGLGQLGGAFSM